MDALLPEGLTVKAVSLAAGEDPDSFLASQGAEALQSRLAAARPALELFLDEQLQLHGDGIEGRARAAEEVLTRIRRLPSDLERDLYLKQLAARTGLDQQLLQTRSGGVATARAAPRPTGQAPRNGPDAAERTQTFLLRLMLVNERARQRVSSEGTAVLFSSPPHRVVADHLLAMADATGNLPEQLLDGLADSAAQALLSGLMLAEDQLTWAADPERIFADCRRAVTTGALRQRLVQLQELIRTAEREGDLPAVEKYSLELLGIKKNL
jgi:DNA primase